MRAGSEEADGGHRRHRGPQAARGPAGAGAGGHVRQGRAAHPVPQHRLFGLNAYGIQPAARAFFGVDAAALTLPQAALLAGLVRSPADDDPFTNPEAATIRRNQVLTRMAAQGYITPAQEAEATAAPLGLAPAPAAAPRVRPGQCRLRLRLRPEVRDAELGITQQELEQDGLVIQTTLDAELQRAGDAAVLNTLPLGTRRPRRSPPCSRAPGTCWR